MKRRTVKFGALALSPFLLLYGYYSHYESFSRALISEQNYHYEDANSIKHAYAAAQLYTVLDTLLDAEDAESLVRWLGLSNERLEQVIRSPKDTAAEVAKDLCNNEAGIVIGKWRAAHPNSPHALRDLSIMLADKKAIRLREASVEIPPEKAGTTGQAAVSVAREAAAALRPSVIEMATAALGE